MSDILNSVGRFNEILKKTESKSYVTIVNADGTSGDKPNNEDSWREFWENKTGKKISDLLPCKDGKYQCPCYELHENGDDEYVKEEDIIAKCHAYGLQTPEFHQEEDFRVVIWRRKNDNADLNVKDFTPYDTPYDISKVKVLLDVLKDGVMSRKELMEKLQLKDIKNFNLLYLEPALSADLIERTIPDKPKSKKQQYRLTEKGFSIK